MKEIEILVKVEESKDKMKKILSKYPSKGVKKTLDVYYYQEDNTTAKSTKSNTSNKLKPKSGMPKEWFRIRDKNGKYSVCYKKDIFEGKKWLYSDEYETEIKDFHIMSKITNQLGYKELVKVETVKHIHETKDYEIVLEEVKGLGLFLEVESKKSGNVKKIKSEISDFIGSLNIKFKEMNMGKPELLLGRKIK